MACYVVNTSAEDDSGKKKCAPVLEDYYECLHHKKEVRVLRAQSQTGSSSTNAPLSMRELSQCKPHTHARNPRQRETKGRARSKYATWACSEKRRMRRRCWVKAHRVGSLWDAERPWEGDDKPEAKSICTYTSGIELTGDSVER